MGIIKNYRQRSLAVILLLLAAIMPLFAQQPMLDKNSEGYYIINSDDDYEMFRQIVATGNPYANAVLTADITVRKPIGSGTRQFHYRGTFDGQCHTVNLKDYTSDEVDQPDSCALFENTAPGCVIRNLRVTGSITVPRGTDYMGSIVRNATCVRIENCVSEVSIGGVGNCLGGLVGVTHGECFIENSAFIGWIASCAKTGGIVGENSEMLNMKSCYYASEYMLYNDNGTSHIFTDNIGANMTILNNYYCTERRGGQHMVTDGQNGTSITMNDIKSGKLCYLLNRNGKKGVVWYQHGSYPYPFKGSDGQFMVSSDEEGNDIHAAEQCDCGSGYESSYCLKCGSAPTDYSFLEPLENRGHYNITEHIVWQDNIKFAIPRIFGDYEKYAIVRGIYGADNHVSAIHIPETITYDNEVFHVNRIADKAFFYNNDIRSCYIPKSITEIGDSAFAFCKNLEIVYIEDSEKTLAARGGSFYGSSADMLYIGRNLAWEESQFGPFSHVQPDYLFIGPRVTRVGNMNTDAYSFEFGLLGSEKTLGMKGIYYMGDEKSLDSELAFTVLSTPIRWTSNPYINRNLNKDHLTRDLRLSEHYHAYDQGVLDGCEDVTFGPFVKIIPELAFSTRYSDSRRLRTVDFSNAFNLEEIGDFAFMRNKRLENDVMDFSHTKLKVIGFQAFMYIKEHPLHTVIFSDSLTTIKDNAFFESSINYINIPGKVTSIGHEAFAGNSGLKEIIFEDGDEPLELTDRQFVNIPGVTYCYLGRNIKYERTSDVFSSSDCLWTIGPKVTLLDGSIFEHDTYPTMYFKYSSTPLKIDKNLNVKVKSLYIDRELRNNEETDASVDMPIIRKSADILQSLSFGNNITEINSASFRRLPGIKNLIIPDNIKRIGSLAFQECTGLEFLSILGSPEIEESAFTGCRNLSDVFLMGNDISIRVAAFHNCHSINNVYTGFVTTPSDKSSSEAFDPETYGRATLIYPGKAEEVTKNAPWSLFHKTEFAYKNTKIFSDDEYCNTEATTYDRAYLSHTFPVNRYDMISMPFDMDSYYFGSDATIYRLNRPTEDQYKENATIDDLGRYRTNNLEFTKVTISDESNKTLKRGETYLLKVDHAEDHIAAYHNLYDSEGIAVNKEMAVTYASETTNYMSEYTKEFDYSTFVPFVIDEGVLKRVNGDYVPQNAAPILYGVNFEQQEVFNLTVGRDKVLVTSKSDLRFHENLEGYSSFYDADYNHIAPDWCDVYVVTGTQDEELVLEQIPDRTITKGQAVMLRTDKDVTKGKLTEYLTYTTHGSTETDLYDRNLLKGVSVDTPANQLSPDYGFVYVLSYNANKPDGTTGFYKLSGDREMPAGKAYLDPSSLEGNMQAKECLFMGTGSQGTGVRLPRTGNRGLNAIYDIIGRRLQEIGDKGIYIINNKKIRK